MAKKKSKAKSVPPKTPQAEQPESGSFVERVGMANLIGYIVAFVVVMGYLIKWGRALLE
jgi:hypothetical protein